MNKELQKGDEVLIFRYVRGYSKQDNYNFIRGTIIDHKESGNLSFHGEPKIVQVYTVLGEDGNEYTGCYGVGLIWDHYFRTIDDQIEFLKEEVQNNYKEIQKINQQNYEIDKMITDLQYEQIKHDIVSIPKEDKVVVEEFFEGFNLDPEKKEKAIKDYEIVFANAPKNKIRIRRPNENKDK